MTHAVNDGLIFMPIIIPLAAALISMACRKRPEPAGLLGALLTLSVVLALSYQYAKQGLLIHQLGGWSPLLGISLRVDGLSLVMLLLTAVTGITVSLYATGYFSRTAALRSTNALVQQRYYWPLWLMLWAGLNGVFLSGDLFNIYVCLELVSLSSVGLAVLSGKPASLNDALRYLLVSLLGSLSYLLGVGFIYRTYGMLDLTRLQGMLEPVAPVYGAIGLISAGLLLKAAFFPLHFWLPPVHANAPAPVSAVLSGLVVKAPWYLLFRFWLELFPSFAFPATTIYGVCGAAAIFWGGFQALRQERLKMLIAYSTVAQIGYLFLIFPLLPMGTDNSGVSAALYFVLAHGFAKAAMFMAAGIFVLQAGHDQLTRLDSIHQQVPVAGFAFGMAGMSLTGLPPSGGFFAKYQYLRLALEQKQWWLAVVILLGSLLTGAYVFKAVAHIFRPSPEPWVAQSTGAAVSQWCAFFLASCAMLLGCMAPLLSSFIGGTR